MKSQHDTIAHMTTPPGRGGIAVVRLAGSNAKEIMSAVFSNSREFQPGQLRFGKILQNGRTIDQAIACCVSDEEFEINIHGGSAVARNTLLAVESRGVKITPENQHCVFKTEFDSLNNPAIGREMLRAIENIVSPFVLRAISTQWSAGLSELLARALTDITAAEVTEQLKLAADRYEIFRKLVNPPEVVLAGAPNAGKSTLTNRLIGRDIAIVHSMAGTTRDWIRERTLINSLPIWLTDTAGLWQAADLHDVDVEAVKRAWQQIKAADLVILLVAGEDNCDLPEPIDENKLLIVRTKADILDYDENALAISTHTGQGLDELKTQIITRLGLDSIAPDAPACFTQRQASLVRQAIKLLDSDDIEAAKEKIRKILGIFN